MITWRIYYADKTTFDNTMGEPQDAPTTGVICIVQKHPDHGFIISATKDFYWFIKDEWYAGDHPGFWQYMFTPGNKIVKFGVSVTDTLYHEIMIEANRDRDFGVKSSKSLREVAYEG